MQSPRVFIPIEVYLIDNFNPLQSSNAKSRVEHYNQANSAQGNEPIHSLVIHPTAMQEQNPDTKQLKAFSHHLINVLQSDSTMASYEYVRNVLSDPSWWPIAYSEVFDYDSKDAFDRFGSIITPIMDSSFANFSLTDFVSRILKYVFVSNYSFWISMQMLTTALEMRFQGSAVTVLWDGDGVRIVHGVERGGELVKAYQMAWDYIPEIWPTETSTLVGYYHLLDALPSQSVDYHFLKSFAQSKWDQLEKYDGWAMRVSSFKYADKTILKYFGITQIEVLGPSRVVVVDQEPAKESTFLITKISTNNGKHATAFVHSPGFWEESDSITPCLVDTYMICLTLDVIEGSLQINKEGEIDRDANTNHERTRRHTDEFEETFGVAIDN